MPGGAGIGGGICIGGDQVGGYAGDIAIYGGEVTASGGLGSAGIGAGFFGRDGTIEIYGGDVRAFGGGDPSALEDWEIVEGEIVPGDSITVRTAQQTHDREDGPGSFDNLIVYTNISSLDRVGELSNCYRIVAKCGRYEITE